MLATARRPFVHVRRKQRHRMTVLRRRSSYFAKPIIKAALPKRPGFPLSAFAGSCAKTRLPSGAVELGTLRMRARAA